MAEDWSIKEKVLNFFSCLSGKFHRKKILMEKVEKQEKTKYHWVVEFKEDLAPVKLSDDEKEVIPPRKYISVGHFHEGLASVSGLVSRSWPERTEGVTHITYGKSRFIDKTGKQIIPLIYDDAGGFEEGLAKVELDDKVGFIDKEGNEYWDMTADEARRQMKNR